MWFIITFLLLDEDCRLPRELSNPFVTRTVSTSLHRTSVGFQGCLIAFVVVFWGLSLSPKEMRCLFGSGAGFSLPHRSCFADLAWTCFLWLKSDRRRAGGTFPCVTLRCDYSLVCLV